MDTNQELFLCPLCEEFKPPVVKNQLQLHLSKHVEKIKFRCFIRLESGKVCPIVKNFPYQLKDHILIDHLKLQLICECDLDKKYSSTQLYNEHKKKCDQKKRDKAATSKQEWYGMDYERRWL